MNFLTSMRELTQPWNPTWEDYERASGAGKKKIATRWVAIACSFERGDVKAARENYYRHVAAKAVRVERISDPQWDTTQSEYASEYQDDERDGGRNS